MPVELNVLILIIIAQFLMGGIELVAGDSHWKVTQQLCRSLSMLIIVLAYPVIDAVGTLVFSAPNYASALGVVVVCIFGFGAFFAGSFTAFMMKRSQ